MMKGKGGKEGQGVYGVRVCEMQAKKMLKTKKEDIFSASI
jgi:hypothetical protein